MNSEATNTQPAHSTENTAADTLALFISDLHLQEEMPATAAAFLTFLEQQATKAKQLYLLGDIFEYWAGDDDITSPFVQNIVSALRRVSDAGVELFWMAGNRDFLVGKAFSEATNAKLLADQHIILCGSKRYLVMHGDQLCTDDIEYQRFRSQVRQPEWQAAFLARPLAERKAIIASVRKESHVHKQKQMQQSDMIMDVNPTAVADLFTSNNVQVVIHGHTHRPAAHHDGKNVRYVLSDWDRDSTNGKLRGDWLALQSNGNVHRFNALGAEENA